jgi:hypothetical protein
MLAVAAAGVIAGAILAGLLLSSPGHSTAGPAHSSAPAVSQSSHPAVKTPRPTATAATEFTVCVVPVLPCRLAQMQTKPTTVLLSGDGSGLIKSLRWSGWGSAVAIASGTYEVDNCKPDCAQGKYRSSPATITLTALTPYPGGKRAYAEMVVSAPGVTGTTRYRHLVP